MELYANEKLMRTYKINSVEINPEINNIFFDKPNAWMNKTFENKLKEFDFWLGDWNVYDYKTKKLIGRSKIKKVAGSFGIEESFYSIPGPFHGKSLNKYNYLKGQWEQFWIDNNGLNHFFVGQYDSLSKKMVFKKEDKKGDGIWYHELIYERQADGSIRQIWKQTNNHKNWLINFNGLYVKRNLKN
jgi:hypothetical protein